LAGMRRYQSGGVGIASRHIRTTSGPAPPASQSHCNPHILRLLFTPIMLSKSVLIVATLAAGAFAAPVKPTSVRSLHKRANPTIGPGFTPQETTQLNDAFRDALQLASYVVSTPASNVDPIFTKYFNMGDRQTVIGKSSQACSISNQPLATDPVQMYSTESWTMTCRPRSAIPF
jgi:hypothetical protein